MQNIHYGTLSAPVPSPAPNASSSTSPPGGPITEAHRGLLFVCYKAGASVCQRGRQDS